MSSLFGHFNAKHHFRPSRMPSRQHPSYSITTMINLVFSKPTPPITSQPAFCPSTIIKVSCILSPSTQRNIHQQNATMRFMTRKCWQLLDAWRNGALNWKVPPNPFTFSQIIETSNTSCRNKTLIADKPDGPFSYLDSSINSNTVQEKLAVNQTH